MAAALSATAARVLSPRSSTSPRSTWCRSAGIPKNYWQSLKKNKEYFLLLLPTFFNETKISFIFVLCYLVLLMKIQWKSMRKLLLASPLLIALIIGLFYAYLDFTDQDADRVLSYE